jgi:accessory colonization factor AcfC
VQWTESQSIDAWLIWNIWQVSNRGNHPQAQAFVDFPAAPEGKAIFRKWGWKTD